MAGGATALGVAGVLLLGVGSSLVRPDWLAAALLPVHGTSRFSPYQTVDARVSAAQAAWMIALAVTGAALFAAGDRRARVAALLPAVLGVAVAIAVVPRGDDYVQSPIDPVARELVCADGTPQVCVSRVNAGVLDDLTPLAREGLALLAKLPNPPTAVHEDTAVYMLDVAPAPRRADIVVIDIRIDKRGRLGHPDIVVAEIVNGLGVRGDATCRDRDPSVERAAAFYLMGRQPVSDVGFIPEAIDESADINAEAVTLWQGLRKLPENEALARVAAVRRAILTCESSKGLLSGSAR